MKNNIYTVCNEIGDYIIAQLVERPLSEREVVGSNPAAAPYQRCKKWY